VGKVTYVLLMVSEMCENDDFRKVLGGADIGVKRRVVLPSKVMEAIRATIGDSIVFTNGPENGTVCIISEVKIPKIA